MQIEIEKETSEKIDKASRALGVKKKELVERAVLVYLDTMGKYVDLKKELQQWDVLSDEALVDFEKAL